ncbi:hypothetical protein SDC9_87634 [bioreactor metagenome]|uniref:Uncharacterized protein n=1 Tax=bioreactor metagenome TaxID=1076179 RepID=A0A644ZJC1_9ZZZZ
MLDDQDSARNVAVRVPNRDAYGDRRFAVEQFEIAIFNGLPAKDVLHFRAVILAKVQRFNGAAVVADDQELAKRIGNQNGGLG